MVFCYLTPVCLIVCRLREIFEVCLQMKCKEAGGSPGAFVEFCENQTNSRELLWLLSFAIVLGAAAAGLNHSGCITDPSTSRKFPTKYCKGRVLLAHGYTVAPSVSAQLPQHEPACT